MDPEEASDKVMEAYDAAVASLSVEDAIEVTKDLIGRLQDERLEPLKCDLRRKDQADQVEDD